jgi:uncharacterized membrane protein YphA (DoxX/SURF4 family)
VAFRFVFIYLSLFCVDLLGYVIWFIGWVSGLRSVNELAPLSFYAWGRIVPWLGSHVFHLSKVIHPPIMDSDSQYDWLMVLVNLVLAALCAAVWSALDRKQVNYRVLWGWLSVVVRILLANEMLSYGMEKVFPLQFGRMGLYTLAAPIGSQNHFALLWHFMASSPGYTIFSGATEVVGGLLLLLPELTPLGALVCSGVMLNVFALNMFYDVKVKVLSFHLLLLSLFLLVPYVSRLADVLVRNRTSAPLLPARLMRRAWGNALAVRWVPLVLGLAMLCFITVKSAAKYKQREQLAAIHSDFYGVWDIDSFNNTGPVTQLLTDKLRRSNGVQGGRDGWKKIIFEGKKSATIELQDGVMDGVEIKQDPATASIHFADVGDDTWKCTCTTTRSSPDVLQLQGAVNGNAVTILLHREPNRSS